MLIIYRVWSCNGILYHLQFVRMYPDIWKILLFLLLVSYYLHSNRRIILGWDSSLLLLGSCSLVDGRYADDTIAMERCAIVIRSCILLTHDRATENLVCVACITGTLHCTKDSEKGAGTKINLTQITFSRLWCLTLFFRQVKQLRDLRSHSIMCLAPLIINLAQIQLLPIERLRILYLCFSINCNFADWGC